MKMNITIEKEVITRIKLNNGKELCDGDFVKFIANGICQYGQFVGITKRGCLQFANEVGDVLAEWAVLPSSIQALEVVE